MIRQVEGKRIVIDSADILLDERNQYVNIGRNSKNLFELVHEKGGE